MMFVMVLATRPTWSSESSRPFPVCYNFSCAIERVVVFQPAEWKYIDWLFKPAAQSAEEERKQVQLAIAWMERFVGRYTPTHNDLARNYTKKNDKLDGHSGQMDCIDEAINTTTYLKLFEERGLLFYHTVLERAYRRAFWNQHWAGRMKEKSTGDVYIFDSWFRNNGEVPYVVAYDEWSDLNVIFTKRDRKRKPDQVVWNGK